MSCRLNYMMQVLRKVIHSISLEKKIEEFLTSAWFCGYVLYFVFRFQEMPIKIYATENFSPLF